MSRLFNQSYLDTAHIVSRCCGNRVFADYNEELSSIYTHYYCIECGKECSLKNNFNMKKFSIEALIRVAKQNDYPIFKRKDNDYNLNIWGIRTSNPVPEIYDDYIIVFREIDKETLFVADITTPTHLRYTANTTQGKFLVDVFRATTDPSNLSLLKPTNKKGTAILKEGHYKAMWIAGKHKGKYEAFVQYNNVTVYRDNNKDSKLNKDVNTDTGVFGINLHRASQWKITELIGLYSEGCQVVMNVTDFDNYLIPLRNKAIAHGYDTFSYTLIKEEQII